MNKLNVLNVSDANKFAFIKGNRPTDEKAIKVKKDSISEHGILCPITAVNGEEVIKSNGHLTDLDGNDIADEHAKDYYAVLDGQHRLKAYLELGLPQRRFHVRHGARENDERKRVNRQIMRLL